MPRGAWWCRWSLYRGHVAILSSTRLLHRIFLGFRACILFWPDFRGNFWRSSGTQNVSCSISSKSSRCLLSNDIKFTWIGFRTGELWLPEVGVPEMFLHVFPAKIPIKRGKPPANRELYVIAGVVIFLTHPGSRINLLWVGEDSTREGGCPGEKCVKSSAHFSLLFVCVCACIWPNSWSWFSTLLVPSESLRYLFH